MPPSSSHSCAQLVSDHFIRSSRPSRKVPLRTLTPQADLPTTPEDEVAHWFSIDARDEVETQVGEGVVEPSPRHRKRRFPSYEDRYREMRAFRPGRHESTVSRPRRSVNGARRNSMRVSTRGRIPADVVDRFIRANSRGS